MVELKSRQAFILKCTTDNQTGVPMNEILQKLNITKRTLYYDLEGINEWLKAYKLGLILIENQKLIVSTDQWQAIKVKLSKVKGYFFSIEERRILEIVYIALSHELVTIEKMQHYFDVSKNTILADIKELKVELGSLDIQLLNTIKSGYYVQGEEFTIRKHIGKIVQRLTNEGPKSAMKELLQSSLLYYTQMDIDFIEISRCVIKQYETDMKGELVPGYVDYECIMILVSWVRCMKGFEFHMSRDEKITLMNTISYQSIQHSILKLEKSGLDIPPVEIFYITTLFLGIRTVDFASYEQENLYLLQFVKEVVRNFERVACISMPEKERLYEQLRYHIRPMYYRLKYGVKTENILLEDIKKMYPVNYDFTCRAFKEIGGEVSEVMTEDELAYLCVYFVSHLNERKGFVDGGSHKQKILIVCAAGMATSVLLKEQIQALLGEIFQYDLVTVNKLKKVHLDQYLIIVSTAFTDELKKRQNIIFTGPIITDEVREEIIQMIEVFGLIPKHDKVIQDIIVSAEHNCTGKLNKTQLYFDIFRLLCDRNDVMSHRVHVQNFQEKIEQGGIIYLAGESSWQDVLLRGCKDLMKEKAYKRLYARMINLFKSKREKVYQICPEVVLIHCPMQGDDNGSVNISIISTEKQVEMKNGMRGSIYLLLTTIDSGSHSYLLESIYQYFDQEGSVDKIKETPLLLSKKV